MTARLALLLLALPLAAAAQSADPSPSPTSKPARIKVEKEFVESPKRANVGVSFGGLFINDDNIRGAYGSGKGFFFTQIQAGLVPWSKYVHVEANIHVGFSQFKGSKTFVNGSGNSADSTMMTLVPISIDGLVGLDLVDEQPVMPYGGVGFNLTPWNEIELEGSSKWNGVRFGGSVFFGGAFLLDVLERLRARRLDANTGINDVYLTVEGRFRRVDATIVNGALDQSGFNLGGWSIAGGLKFVF